VMHLGVHVPERLKKLVLCNTAPKIGVEATWNSRISAVEKGGMAAVTDAVLERWFTPQFRQASPSAETSTKEKLLATPTEGYVAC
jgi:3-oxoadipate enol-lactonase